MYMLKYPEKDGIIVYTPIKTWSKARKEEYTLREWEHLNGVNFTTKEMAVEDEN